MEKYQSLKDYIKPQFVTYPYPHVINNVDFDKIDERITMLVTHNNMLREEIDRVRRNIIEEERKTKYLYHVMDTMHKNFIDSLEVKNNTPFDQKIGERIDLEALNKINNKRKH